MFTVDDRVVTAAGIDLALDLVATRHGPAAAQVARDMVVHARRNGHGSQTSAMLRHRSHLDDTVNRARRDHRRRRPLGRFRRLPHAACRLRARTT